MKYFNFDENLLVLVGEFSISPFCSFFMYKYTLETAVIVRIHYSVILHLVHLNVIEADSNAIYHSEAELNWALNPAGQAPQHKERIPLLSKTQDLLYVLM